MNTFILVFFGSIPLILACILLYLRLSRIGKQKENNANQIPQSTYVYPENEARERRKLLLKSRWLRSPYGGILMFPAKYFKKPNI